MKYLDPRLTVGQPAKVTGCSACIYGRGKHDIWCPHYPTVSRLLHDYWAAQAQFGPLDIGPEEFVRKCREEE
jgi:hypothetical protein